MEDEDSPWLPVWMTLPGLPSNYFLESMLRSIGDGFGKYLKRDNAAACVTQPKAAQICVELDISSPLRHSFWLGPPHGASSHFQEIFYEAVPSYCGSCRKQGHMEFNCKRGRLNAEIKQKNVEVAGDVNKKLVNQVWKEVDNKEE